MGAEYIAVIADIKGSRKLDKARRISAQDRLRALVRYLNQTYEAALAAHFAITIGDEIQGLFRDARVLPATIWDIHVKSQPARVYIGIGRGELMLPLRHVAIDVDGPALHRAREAMEAVRRSAKKWERKEGQDKVSGKVEKPLSRAWEVYKGFGEPNDAILTGLSAALFAVRNRMAPQQLAIADQLKHGSRVVEAAKKLGISQASVSKSRLASYYDAYRAGEDGLGLLLARLGPSLTRDIA